MGENRSCIVCNEGIPKSKESRTSSGLAVHQECFKCDDCGNEAEKSSLRLSQDKFYCTEHFPSKDEEDDNSQSSVRLYSEERNESIEEEAEENRPKKRKITIRKVKSSFNDPQTNMVVSGILPAKFAGTEEGEMSVTARVTDLEKWKSLEGVKHHTEIRMPSKGQGELYLVTGRVKMSEAKNVNSQDFVKSFKVSRKLMPQRAGLDTTESCGGSWKSFFKNGNLDIPCIYSYFIFFLFPVVIEQEINFFCVLSKKKK